MIDDYIIIKGAKENNLKNVSLAIPRNKLVVITGLSGSGKSSLAFNTIYAEGQRRYMDTLSSYARNFVGTLQKPDVESISGLSPVIAIEQKTTGKNPRSTVGTITEIYDFIRLLYAKIADAYSPLTGEKLVQYTDKQIIELILELYNGRKCLLLAPLVHGRKGHYKELLESLRKKGYQQVRIDGKIELLSEVEQVERYSNHFIELVVDKLKPKAEDYKRISDSLENALNIGKGSIAILDVETEELKHFSKYFIDPQTGLSIQNPAPHSFSFNSPQGYCPQCKGLGEIKNIDKNSIIPNPKLSIAEGAFIPLGRVRENKKFELIRSILRKYNASVYTPVEELPTELVDLIIYGSEELFRIGEGLSTQMLSFDGIVEDIEEKITCPSCQGTRLRSEVLYFKIDGKTISEICNLEIADLLLWVKNLPAKLNSRQQIISQDIIKTIEERLQFLLNVGLDYLSLSRSTASLSGGESQRIRLATQIGSKLVNVLYILDEPSIGLHQRDNIKLIKSLKNLRDEGNSLIVVEHDEQTMLAADWLIDVGPKAGKQGGFVCRSAALDMFLGENPSDKKLAEDNPSEKKLAEENPAEGYAILGESITAKYLKGVLKNECPKNIRQGNGKFLKLFGAKGNNLKNIDLNLPLGCFIGISGVSGSGKSTLINETLMPILKNYFYKAKLIPLAYDKIEGIENIDKVIEVNQSSIGRNSRSNPATFTGVFDEIRNLFASCPDALARGISKRMFSFNLQGGQCPDCKGYGNKSIEMNFLPSVEIICEQCRGKRYKPEVLAVKYRGKSISDILEMPISEALHFFQHIPKIADKLQALEEVGLGYLHLGQSATTLSGGESQRMKLAQSLAKKSTSNSLYLLDEPTTGLHFEDIKILLSLLQKLVDEGNTVLVIEHNLDILRAVDWLIDLGPDGGEKGGYILAEASPIEIKKDKNSLTGKYL